MPAPSNTQWGAIVGDYGRIGISVTAVVTSTTYKANVEVWFWSKYAVSDSANNFYFNEQATSGGDATANYGTIAVSTTVSTGDGWSTSNQKKLKSFTFTYNKGTTYVTRYLTAKFADVDRVGGTMYARNSFTINRLDSYTVGYNANGGSGAPSSQTKTHGTALILSSTKPTRTNYKFLGWGTSASATTVAYAAGASYTANSAATLYAIWELDYVKPIIYNLSAARCNPSGEGADDGTCGLVKFEWKTTNTVSSITIAWVSTAGAGSKAVPASGTSGSIEEIVGESALSTDAEYSVTVTVADSGGSNTANITLSGSFFLIDALAGGKGISFGKPAEKEGVAEFALDAEFNKPVYGKALGMDRLPAIPADSDLNNYMETGCYAVHSNAIAETVANIPVARAGRLEVWSSTGEGVRTEQWSYLRQRYIPYNSSNAVWEREITRSSDNVWRYYDWWKSSLTPAAAEKVYSRAAITVALNANVTLGELNTYTKIPFDKLVISTSDRLTMLDGSIRIGEDIEHVKVSGQVLIKCGTVAGTRHARIQKVSGTTTTSIAWCVINAAASSNMVYPFTPIIVPVKEGDLLKIVYYTSDTADANVSGSSANGWQTYLTVEEL